MKISILGTTTYPTPPLAYGGEVMIYDLAYGLHELGHEVTLFAVKNPYITYPFKLNMLMNTYGKADWNAECTGPKHYETELLASDVILDMSHGKMASERFYHLHGKRNIALYMIGNYYGRPTVPFNVIVNSQNQLDGGIKGATGFEGTPWESQHGYTGHIPPTSKFCHLGINTNFYTLEEKKQDYYLWLARFHPMKGPMVAIQLAKETGINLIIAGDMISHPEHMAHGQECLKAIEGWSNIQFVQLPQDQTHQRVKMELMKNAKAYLFTVQFHESFGLTVCEALSCGTPVIATNLGAMPEIIKSGETGFIAPDYEHFKTFLGSIDTIKPSACRKDVEERFSRLAMAKRFEKILIELNEGKTW